MLPSWRLNSNKYVCKFLEKNFDKMSQKSPFAVGGRRGILLSHRDDDDNDDVRGMKSHTHTAARIAKAVVSRVVVVVITAAHHLISVEDSDSKLIPVQL